MIRSRSAGPPYVLRCLPSVVPAQLPGPTVRGGTSIHCGVPQSAPISSSGRRLSRWRTFSDAARALFALPALTVRADPERHDGRDGGSRPDAIFIFATAVTLHASGVTIIQTSSQAAEALRPIAGAFTFAVFAAGIVGTGLLAVPILAGSGAYALSEAFKWREGLDRRLLQAKSFYATIAVSTMAGVGLNFTSLDPVKALYWSAVVNGVLAAPVMAVMMLIAGNGRIMGRLTLPPSMLIGGGVATGIMLVASAGFFLI